jgi:hypothetical protein
MKTQHIAAWLFGPLIAAGVMAAPLNAADLGGNCCADLEERIATLEATVAKKGTRKVSLQIYGEVNKAFVWLNDGSSTEQRVIDNSVQGSRFGFRGEGVIRPDFKAGFVIEIGAD